MHWFTKQLTLPHYSRMVPLAEIEKHDFNLNIPRYSDEKSGHSFGGEFGSQKIRNLQLSMG